MRNQQEDLDSKSKPRPSYFYLQPYFSIENLMGALLIIQVVLMVSTSYLAQYSVSELWHLTTAKDFLNLDRDLYTNWSRFTFFSTLKPFLLFFDNNAPLLLSARFLFTCIGLVIIALTYKLTHLLSNNKKLSIFVCIIILANEYFFTRSFRIRSDLMATCLNLLTLFLYFKWFPIVNSSKINKIILCALSLLTLMSTPKSVYHLIINASIIYSTNEKTDKKNNRRFSFLVLIVFPIISVAIIIAFSKFILNFDSIYLAYLQSLSYYVSAFNDYYHTTKEALYLISGFLLILILLYLFNKRILPQVHLTQQSSTYILWAIASAFIMGLHNQKYPFFIASYVPLLIIPLILLLQSLIKRINSKAILLLSTSLVLLSYVEYKTVFEKSLLKDQLTFIKKYESFLQTNPSISYFDGTGLLPLNNQYPYYFGPNEIHNKQWFNLLKSIEPDVILYTPRITIIEPELGVWLRKNYYHHGNGIWFKCISIGKYTSSYKQSSNKKVVQIFSEDLERIMLSELNPKTKSALIKWNNLDKIDTNLSKIFFNSRSIGNHKLAGIDMLNFYKNFKFNELLHLPESACLTRYYDGSFTRVHLGTLFSYDNF